MKFKNQKLRFLIGAFTLAAASLANAQGAVSGDPLSQPVYGQATLGESAASRVSLAQAQTRRPNSQYQNAVTAVSTDTMSQAWQGQLVNNEAVNASAAGIGQSEGK